MLLLYAGMYTTLLCNVAYPIPHLDNKNKCDELYCVVTIHQLTITHVCIFIVFNLQSMLDIVC